MSIIQMLLTGVAGNVVTTDQYFNYTTLLLPGNGTNGAQNNTFIDSGTANSGVGFSITRNGNTTQGTFSPFSQTGWSNFFNGSSDFLNIGSGYPASLDLGSSNFTIEGWVYLQATTKQLLLGNLNDSNGTCTFFVVLNNTSASARYEIKFGGSAFNLGTGTIPTNQWVHVCVMRSGTSLFLFENGSQVGTTQTLSGSITSSTNQMRVGGAIANQYPLSGYASNLRMVIGSVVYSTSGFTVPTSPLTAITNTALLTCQSNRFFDASTNAISITTSGTPSVQAFSPFAPTAAYSTSTVGGSGYFDGSGDHLITPSNAALGLGTGDFTVECWYYHLSRASTDGLFAPGTSNLNIYINTSGTLGYFNGTSGQNSSQTVPLNAWGHIALVRISGTIKMYYNGVEVLSQSNTTNFSTTNWYIGTNSALDNDPAHGYMTDARIVKGTAVYTSAFTPPTAPLTAISGTSLLLNFTNGGITDATAKNDLETVGGASISTTQSKFGGSSMYFDGNGDYLIGPPNPNIELGSGDYTIECWVNISAAASNGGIISKGPVNTLNNATWSIEFNGSQNTLSVFIYAANTTVYIINGTSNIKTSTWIHVALSRSGNNTRFFINGVQEGSTYTSGYTISTGDPIFIGGNFYAPTTRTITGYINDLRITKGIARYTANFTPPTVAFPVQ